MATPHSRGEGLHSLNIHIHKYVEKLKMKTLFGNKLMMLNGLSFLLTDWHFEARNSFKQYFKWQFLPQRKHNAAT
jgi:hypothetical protein